MAYYVDLFSPDTYRAFTESTQTLSGFRESQRHAADRVQPGDILIAYLTKVSRWVGLLVVEDGPFVDPSPLFRNPDPFIVRFHVHPRLWLPVEAGIPIRDPACWATLTFTRQQNPATATWTGKLRASLTPLDSEDGNRLVELLEAQVPTPSVYPLTTREQSLWRIRPTPGPDRDVIIPLAPALYSTSIMAVPARCGSFVLNPSRLGKVISEYIVLNLPSFRGLRPKRLLVRHITKFVVTHLQAVITDVP